MSRTKRTFSPEFKAKLVLEVLKGEKELNVIATENDIQPNLLRNTVAISFLIIQLSKVIKLFKLLY